MAIFQQSPGVQIQEKNLTLTTPGASTTVGAYVGAFQWGPVMTPMLIDSENTLVDVFGRPDDNTFSHFFSAANFLSYTNAMWVVRAATTNLNSTSSGTGLLIKNIDSYESLDLTADLAGTFAARYPGKMGNSISVSIADAVTFDTWAYKDEFAGVPSTSDYVASKGGSNDELHIIVIDRGGLFTGTPGSVLEKFAFVSKATDAVSYQGLANYYVNVLANQSQYIYWMGHPVGATNWGIAAALTIFTSLPVDDGIVINSAAVAADVATLNFAAKSVAPYTVGQSITVSGMTPAAYNGTFIVTSVTLSSVSFALVGAPGVGTIFGVVSAIAGYDFSYSLSGGTDDNTPEQGELISGWDLLKDTQAYDISLLVTGSASKELAQSIVQNVADTRKDCVAFTSITTASGPILGTSTSRFVDAKAFKTFDSTYAVIDSGYKYMYDKYNDKYRWIALNADTAGLCARVDATQDTWFSPAGMTKGQIKGAIKLSWNPNKTERDQLYPMAINPVINQVGQGTILFGDRTATTKPSAFDRINVRRLFLVMEKSIERSARFQLFEQNDDITRMQFVASVEPFLRDIQGRRGIDDFKVICDETNNTPSIVANNEFRGNILVKPRYSINFITLTFTAVGPNVSFEVAAGA